VRKEIVSAMAIGAMMCSSLGATPATPKKKRHAAASGTAASHKRTRAASASKTASATGSRTTTANAKRKGKKSRTPVRAYQQAPSADRYKEIQEALAKKGFFQGEPSGQWGPDSMDALKRFQASQSLSADGKINSLSLIALGLGPKHLSASSAPAPPSQPGNPAAPQSTPATTAPPQ
jgi:murein L,D-transpeptidase YcbB/YkuD